MFTAVSVLCKMALAMLYISNTPSVPTLPRCNVKCCQLNFQINDFGLFDIYFISNVIVYLMETCAK